MSNHQDLIYDQFTKQAVPFAAAPGIKDEEALNPGDTDKIRRMFIESLDNDGLGMGTHRQGDKIRFAYPIAVLCSELS